MNDKAKDREKNKIKVPKPSRKFLKHHKTEFSEEELKEISKYSLKKTFKKTIIFYLGMIFNILFSVSGIAIILVRYILFKKPLTWVTILFIIIAIPVFISGVVGLIIKLFFDRKKISSKVTQILTKNYIVADFFTSSKKILTVIRPLNDDGISFSIGKREYIVDKEVIWYDAKKRPHSYYLPELPNPIRFNFKKTIDEYFQILDKIKKGEYAGTIENDIAFSSTNLKLFKKDKIFKDLNTAEGSVAQKTFTGLLIFSGAIIFVMLIVIIVLAVV